MYLKACYPIDSKHSKCFSGMDSGYVIECIVALKITTDKGQACNTMFSFENNDIFNWKLGE